MVNLRGEGKMPSRLPAGRRRYSRFPQSRAEMIMEKREGCRGCDLV
jgi:hypothetical protein